MLNAEGLMLLRTLIFKMWALNEARQNCDFAAMAREINTWMPPDMAISPGDVERSLRGADPVVALNAAVLRDKIDGIPALFSARINGDYQAILNEIRRDPVLAGATIADVCAAMAYRPVARPSLVAVGAAKLVGAARLS